MSEESPSATGAQAEHGDVAAWPIEHEMRILVASGRYLDQDAVYKHLSTALPIEEVIAKVEGDFGKETSEKMIAGMRGMLGEEYVRLLVEPSLSTRFDDFIAFAQNAVVQEEGLTPWDVRNKFKDSLSKNGKKMVYRVSTANPTELENLYANGFTANFYRHRSPQTLLQNQDGYETIEYALSDLRGRVNVHAGAFADTKDSLFVSVSEYPEMAQYAATVQLRDRLAEMEAQDGSNLYMFAIEIDEFCLVRYGRYLSKTISGKGVWTDGTTEIPYEDPGVEALIEFQIPPEAIKKDKVKVLDPTQIPVFHYVKPERA
jgi:hypothetical protein